MKVTPPDRVDHSPILSNLPGMESDSTFWRTSYSDEFLEEADNVQDGGRGAMWGPGNGEIVGTTPPLGTGQGGGREGRRASFL